MADYSAHLADNKERSTALGDALRAAYRGQETRERERPAPPAKPSAGETDRERQERFNKTDTRDMSAEEYAKHFPGEGPRSRTARADARRHQKLRDQLKENLDALKPPDEMPDIDKVREDHGRVALVKQKVAEGKEGELPLDRHADRSKRQGKTVRQSVELAMAIEGNAPSRDEVARQQADQHRVNSELGQVRKMEHANHPAVRQAMQWLLQPDNFQRLAPELQKRIMKNRLPVTGAYHVAVELSRQHGLIK